MRTPPNITTSQYTEPENTVIKFMREMREEFGQFEFKAVSPGGTTLVSKNWHRVKPDPKRELPLFLREEPVR